MIEVYMEVPDGEIRIGIVDTHREALALAKRYRESYDPEELCACFSYRRIED